MIYVIGNREMDICKIGYSKRPNRRIETIRKKTPYPLEIFVIREGDMQTEAELHAIFSKHNVKGEWFKLSGISTHEINIEHIPFLGGYLIKDGDYIQLRRLVKLINENRLSNGEKTFNSSQFFNKKEMNDFIEDMENRGIIPIKKEFSKMVHFYIAVEICRHSGARIKSAIYDLLLSGTIKLSKYK